VSKTHWATRRCQPSLLTASCCATTRSCRCFSNLVVWCLSSSFVVFQAFSLYCLYPSGQLNTGTNISKKINPMKLKPGLGCLLCHPSRKWIGLPGGQPGHRNDSYTLSTLGASTRRSRSQTRAKFLCQKVGNDSRWLTRFGFWFILMARKYNCKTQHTSFSFSYLSQVWHLSDNSTHKISVAWDNFFRCVFHVVVETVLNYYIIFSPHSEYRISAVQICLLEKKNYWSDNTVYCLCLFIYNTFITFIYNTFITFGFKPENESW